jgi:hypothetical protein
MKYVAVIAISAEFLKVQIDKIWYGGSRLIWMRRERWRISLMGIYFGSG